MSEAGELSQEVINEAEVPGLPWPTGPEWGRWERLGETLNIARQLEVVRIPAAIEDLHTTSLSHRIDRKPAPSMAPIKRELVRLREEIAWTLRTAGYAQIRIGQALGVSQPAVSKILRRVERRALARMEADVRVVKAKQSAQLEYILDQALRAWKNSQDRIEERIGTTADLTSREKASRTTSTRRGPGDPRFLLVALKALSAERELWGLNRSTMPSDPDPTATIQATRIESVTVRQPLERAPRAGR
jgi:predicted transcriptional regulator